MKRYGKNTARLAVTAGLCASMTLACTPTAAIAEKLGLDQPAAVDQLAAVEPAEPGAAESAEADAVPVDSASEPEPAAEQPVAEAPTGYVVVDENSVTIKDLDALKYTAGIAGNGLTGGAYYDKGSSEAGGKLTITKGDKETIVEGKFGDAKVIKLEAGVYDAFTVPAGVTVEGAGAGKTIIKNSAKSKLLLNGDNITLKNLTVDSSADGNPLASDKSVDHLVLEGVEFLGNGKAGSAAIYIHEPSITIKNCVFKDFERGYYTCGDNHAIGQMTFTGNTFTNVKVPLDGYWGKPAADGNKIIITGNTLDGGSWGKAHVQLWDYAQYQHWLNGANSQHNPKGATAIDAVVKDNMGDFDLILTHGNWYSLSNLETDHEVVKRTLVEIAGTDVESVVVKNADGTPVTSWNESPDSSNRGNRVVIYSLSEGDYIFEITHKAKGGADAIVTSQEVTVAAPESNGKTPSVEVTPLPENVSVATVVKTGGSKETYGSLEQAIRAAEQGDVIELDQDVKVAAWNQIWPDGSPSKLDGITIDGKGHSLTIDKIASSGNGNYMFFQAKNVTVEDITINLPKGGNGFDMESGSLVNVTFNGGSKAAYLGGGDITVDGCTFNNVEHALYTESKTGKAEVKNSAFTGCDYVVIMHKPGSSFVRNTVSGGKLNIMGAEQKVQGNTFEDGSRIKFYANSVEGAFSKNNISKDSTVVLDAFGENADLDGNYWGSPDGPVAEQLPEGATVDSWYEDEGMTHLNTDPEVFEVTFVYGNGDENKAVEVEEGKTVARPADPVRKGYAFAGWYMDANFKNEFDFSGAVSSNLTLYAKWVKDETPASITHKVTFVPVVGGDATIVVEVKEGAFVELPATPELNGYTFAGWFLDKDYKKPFDAEKTAITGDLTLYGGWFKKGSEKPVTPQKPAGKPALPQTGDASAVAMAISGIAGVAAIAAGAVSSKRRKAE